MHFRRRQNFWKGVRKRKPFSEVVPTPHTTNKQTNKPNSANCKFADEMG